MYNAICRDFSTYVYDNIDAEIRYVNDGLFVVNRYLGMMDQPVQILIGNAVFTDHVQSDNAQFVQVVHCLIEENRCDVSHMVLDAFAFRIGSHS